MNGTQTVRRPAPVETGAPVTAPRHVGRETVPEHPDALAARYVPQHAAR